jgi:hypothetical protein
MRRRPLGCMTATALLVAGATVLLLVGAAVVTSNGIFSPGPLNAEAGPNTLGGVDSHAALSGDCGACHVAIWSGDTMGSRCLGCHASVDEELVSGTGIHGRFATGGECRTCHTDHKGETASLTLANPPDFPHDATGFSLHAHPVGPGLLAGGFRCADCHTNSVRTFDAETCRSCHERVDPPYTAEHVATFGSDCLACHDGVDTYGRDFAHATWSLDGRHAETPCAACHEGAVNLVALRSTPATCASCHAIDDVHEGRLGADCAACHSAVGWGDTTDRFDHARTAFALTGRHRDVDCLACHVNRTWSGIGTTCESCHGGSDDPHGGQFTQGCASCHTADGWDAVTFDHAATGFTLTGAHAEPACEACHPGGRYAGTPTACAGCHATDDAHEGNLGSRCEACHSVKTWKDTTFNHDQARFPLTGSHQSALCSACHKRLTMYRGTPTTCYACHRADDAHDGALGSDCSACHGTRTWQDATFDHARTRFPLTGAHTTTRCAACHPGNRYVNTPRTCVACHKGDDAHDGSFGTACDACHSTRSWSGATVDHSKTAFPLTGAHRSVACVKCHRNNTFAGTPKACNACHTKPGTHQPSSFSACASCHSTRAWRPADFNAPHRFPTGHRNAGGVCSRCHPSTWASYSCASCHSNAVMDEHHKEVADYSRTTCAKCHPTGRNN